MVCGAKRIRSLHLPWMTGVIPELSTKTRPKAWPRSPLQRRDYALLQSRPSLPLLTHCGQKPLPQRSSSRSLPLGEKDGHIRGRTRWFVHNAGYAFC
jgi:hypothetical protein